MLVVHSWDAAFVGLVDTLAAHVRDEHTALWLDAFAVSQVDHQQDPAALLEVIKARSLNMWHTSGRCSWCVWRDFAELGA